MTIVVSACLVGLVGFLALGAGWDNGMFTAQIVNDTGHTVSIVQCQDSCSPGNLGDPVQLRPGQSDLENDVAGIPQPWILQISGDSVACLTLYKPSKFTGTQATFYVSKSQPLARCR